MLTNGEILQGIKTGIRLEVLDGIELMKRIGMSRDHGGHFLAVALGEIIAEIEVGIPDFRKQVAAAMDTVATQRPALKGIITP